MPTPNIPDGYNQLMPYLIVNNAAGFITFMKEVFEAEEIRKEMRGENTIMHGEIKIGQSIIMFADSTNAYQPQTAGLFIYVTDADESYNNALKAGAASVMPPADQNYGRSGGIKDPFGNTWWITSAPAK